MNEQHAGKGSLRAATAGLALVCALEAAALLAPRPAPPVLAPAPRPTAQAARAPLPEPLRGDPAFAAMMTPDDVARGLLSLLALPAEAPLALSEAQREALAPLAHEALETKRRLDALRTKRRALELQRSQVSAQAARALGPERLAAMLPAPPPAAMQPAGPPPAGMQPPPPGGAAPRPPSPPERR
ncbi:MAG: hypothetical protein H6741_06145 [Alphaproteobacteria bacterium]|nr:hypothetical protein [Alphaproteobacteria bacterium]MCB9792290.1 hypothetical protein [Alphaproteobacteria bacterium]